MEVEISGFSDIAVAGSCLQRRANSAGVAGIYDRVKHSDGREMFTMAMLTVNAHSHPFMRRFHKPEDEKRMVVILAPADYQRWLDCSVEEAAGLLRQWHGPLLGEHVPAPGRKKAPKADSSKLVRPKPEQDELF